jgi:hypothetical protein
MHSHVWIRASCLVNPYACHESELLSLPTKIKKKIAVSITVWRLAFGVPYAAPFNNFVTDKLEHATVGFF